MKGLDLLHLTIAKGKKEFFKMKQSFKWNKVKLGESLFSRWILLFGIMLEIKEGVSYLLRIKITLYGSSWHDILITMQRSCNSGVVYFSRYSRKVFNLHILCATCTYMQIHIFSKFYNLLYLLLMWEIWETIILLQLCILLSYVPAKANTVLSAPKISCLI